MFSRSERRRRAGNPGPVVVASLTRTGSTLLQRLLNTHPHLTVWGEHFGILRPLGASLTALERARDQIAEGYDQHRRLIDCESDIPDLMPQVNPFDVDGFASHLRDMLERAFTSELDRHCTWGFKEVRYGSTELSFIERIFPDTRVIILVRRPETQISSFVRAPWRRLPTDPPERARALEAMVSDAATAWTDRYADLRGVYERRDDRTLVVRFEDLASTDLDIDALFSFCGLDPSRAPAAASVLQTRSFSSDDTDRWTAADLALLDRLIAEVEFPENHDDVLRFYYGDVPDEPGGRGEERGCAKE